MIKSIFIATMKNTIKIAIAKETRRKNGSCPKIGKIGKINIDPIVRAVINKIKLIIPLQPYFHFFQSSLGLKIDLIFFPPRHVIINSYYN